MGEIRRYTPDDAATWNAFVEASKNGTFLFNRGYMDYHADRFTDYSLLYFNAKGKLWALLPANLTPQSDGSLSLCSHQGLTYGGFILCAQATMSDVMDMFIQTIDYLKANNVKTFFYKQVPTCYHTYPSQEDEYALWRLGAALSVCNISSTIEFNGQQYAIPFERRRKRGIARAEKAGYTISETRAIEHFWKIMESNLKEKYSAAPVHTIEEMNLLMQRFPDNIKCFIAERDGELEAGALMYLTPQVAHVQYAHASPVGKEEGALDLLYATLIKEFSTRCRFFDIGSSNEEGGHILNTNLIAQKEGFGARGITYKQWKFLI